MVRWSMFVGWWQLILNPKQIFRRPSTGSEDFVMLSPRTAASQQMQNIDLGLRRRSSGQVVRPSVDEATLSTPRKTQFVEEPAVEERERPKEVREEEVMV